MSSVPYSRRECSLSISAAASTSSSRSGSNRGHAGTSSSSVSGRFPRSASSRSGSGPGCSSRRLIQTRAQPELTRRRDVVEEARRDVDVTVAVRGRRLEEALPVPVRGLVGADVLGHDREVDRDAELLLRRGDQVAVGVGEERELPAAVAQLCERRRHVREGRPVRERPREGARLALGELDALLLGEPLEREREHFAVGVERLGLELRLELVVALEQARRLLDAEQPLELAADPCVPVDQRAVTVEGRPTRSACP